jgi:hypothetical protein
MANHTSSRMQEQFDNIQTRKTVEKHIVHMFMFCWNKLVSLDLVSIDAKVSSSAARTHKINNIRTRKSVIKSHVPIFTICCKKLVPSALSKIYAEI